MRVIVVEDNILFCDYICNFLQNADYQTVKAYRLAQARQVIARSVREDDIVLADLRLPDGESTALLEWMRGQGYTHPFIMMTNYEEIHTAVHAMKLGAEDYILKPLLEDKLLPALKKIRMADEAFAKVIYERKSAAFRELDRYIRLVAPHGHDGAHTRQHGDGQGASGGQDPQAEPEGEQAVHNRGLRKPVKGIGGIRLFRPCQRGVHGGDG